MFHEGYTGDIQRHTAAAIESATRASIEKRGSRRISWGISKNRGLNVSIEDLRRRSTKFVVLGLEDVGKTAFVVRFVTKRFISEYMSDRHSCYEHELTYTGGEKHYFEIMDLSNKVLKDPDNEKGGEEFDDHIKWGDAFLLMYSTTDRVSFNEVSRLAMTIRLLHKNTHPKPILVLIGTKVDLEPQRIVSELEGKKLAESLNARFYEVSSKDDYNEVARIFRESANVCRLNMVKTPLLMRRASATALPPSSNGMKSFKSRGKLASVGDEDSED
ncbi:Oidioi.mRNA.OKI2018_I69.chr1.g1027.t1.cds [Oikopleura dioica]|uniref:small monomeric GTPase n=1 Tax=Oikopleura dioica TaxID=34765 RepID=A0ABN7SNF1_OIKDI|nr:Oidioi.mRNA.OKI2018_I69.chr1.g1027.t1.cds [Oikopleura dioica]